MNDEKIDLSIFLKEYLSDARDGFQKANNALLSLEKDHSEMERLDEIYRVIHTLKSSSAMIGFTAIAELSHSSEDLIGKMRNGEIPVTQETIDLLFEIMDTLEQMVKGKGGTSSELRVRSEELKLKIKNPKSAKSEVRTPKSEIERIETIRVHTSLLDALFNQVGELMIAKNRIDTILSGTADKELKALLSAIGRMIAAMQENVSQARLVPVDEIFQKFPRMVRDLSKEKNKDIELIIEGREIELDKAVLDAITEPLMHLLRNAVDHGIESPDERQRQDKNRQGTIKLIAERSENHILIIVEDDGRGIDISGMKDYAVKKGFIKEEEAEMMEDRDIINLLFSPGFSSTEDVTDLSGRGIGLHVVKTVAREMGGTVEVSTEKGKGAKFSLTLPLTTAVIQTLMVEEGSYVFAIPSDIVLETQRIKREDIKEIEKGEALIHEEKVIPFTRLGNILNIPYEKGREPVAVIIQRGERRIGVGVDGVIGQLENIVKPFDPIAREFKGFSGGIILGDGRVALLLDIPTLFRFETLKEERYVV
jgi:two-component system chemotaxis sensor kinase CheA